MIGEAMSVIAKLISIKAIPIFLMVAKVNKFYFLRLSSPKKIKLGKVSCFNFNFCFILVVKECSSCIQDCINLGNNTYGCPNKSNLALVVQSNSTPRITVALGKLFKFST